MFKRNDYMDKKCTHREYYAQFVTATIKKTVKDFIGMKTLLASKNPHFNDIPLSKWDQLTPIVQFRDLKKYNETYCLSFGVCVLKEAAHQLVDDK